jgi:hypothetical protein
VELTQAIYTVVGFTHQGGTASRTVKENIMATRPAVCLAPHPKYAGVRCTEQPNHEENGHRNCNMQQEQW